MPAAAKKKSPPPKVPKASATTIDVKPINVVSIQMANPVTAAAEIQSRLTRLAAEITLLKSTAATYEQQAADMLVQVKGVEKALKEKLETITIPLNTALKNARGLFKPAFDRCEAIETSLRQGIIAYRQIATREAEQKRLEASKRADEAAERGDMKGALEAATEAVTVTAPARVVQATLAVAQATSNVRYAQVASRKRWTFDVENVGKVPRQYLEVNDKMVRAAISSGIRKIDGIHIFEEDGLAVGGR